jgi:hypothetical protein
MDIAGERELDGWSTANLGGLSITKRKWKVTFRPAANREDGNGPHRTGTLGRSHQHDVIAELGLEFVV